MAAPTHSINSSFTEGTDIYFANAGFTVSGASLETAHKASGSVSTEQPTFTFAGTPNRQVAMALTLRGATALDYSVTIRGGGGGASNDYAQTTVSWPTTDTYAVYGGPTDLWGKTWTIGQIQSAAFGVDLRAIRQSGAINVDHIRITVYASAPTPVELLYFKGKIVDQEVLLEWETATEDDNDYFTVEYSSNGLDFNPIETIAGAGTSKIPIKYQTTHANIYEKNSYYRLKQTDYDGQFTYSKVIRLDTRDLVKDLSMFPNPASASITILNSAEEDVGIRIISQTGVLVFEQAPQRQFLDLDISAIPNGLYLVELIRGRTRSTQKLLVSH